MNKINVISGISKLSVRHMANTNSILFGNRKRKLLYAMLAGTGAGACYAFYQSRPVAMPDLTDLSFANSLAKRSLSDHVQKVHHDTLNKTVFGKLTLYQFFSCPFCCKVRAYLDYYGIDYDIVEVNSVTKSQLKWSDYKKVPILVIEDEKTQINDSNVIISLLEAKVRNRDIDIKNLLPLYGPTLSQKNQKVIYNYSNVYNIPGLVVNNEEITWRSWVDKQLIPVAGLSIYDTLGESIRSFKWFAKAGNWSESFGEFSSQMTIYSGAAVMYMVSKMKNRSDKPSLDKLVETLSDQLSVSLFIGGEQPNIADITAYGALMALSGCDKFTKVVSDPTVAQWWTRMQQEVNNHSGNVLLSSKPLPNETLKSSMMPVLITFLIAKLIGIKLINDNVF